MTDERREDGMEIENFLIRNRDEIKDYLLMRVEADREALLLALH
jgi:hypothetical protein